MAPSLPALLLLACVALCGAETFPRSAGDRAAVVAPVVAAHTEAQDLEPQTFASSSSSSTSGSSSAAASSASSTSSASSASSASATSASASSEGTSSGPVELAHFLRGSGSFGSGGGVTVEDALLPGGANGFGHVTYDDDASSKMVASAFGGMRAGESQAAYRARIRKMQRAAERRNPDLRLQNLVAF